MNQDPGQQPSRTLETAADELRSSLERQVRDIVRSAEERAAQIEHAAAQKAEQLKRPSHPDLEGSIEEEIGRTWAILGGIDELETRVNEVVHGLRTELTAVIKNLESLRTDR